MAICYHIDLDAVNKTVFFYDRERLKMTWYLTISEILKKWEVKARRINTLCLKGRIDGTVKFGNA